jgi:glycosyltransferase involved in cell wall biosynthesis
MKSIRKLSMVLKRWVAELRVKPASATVSVCFFVPEKSRGWILEAAFREIAQRLPTSYVFAENYKKLPEADVYFFCHYHFYLSALQINPWLANERCFVWFTHPKESEIPAETIESLRKTTVIAMCSKWRNYLIGLGLQSSHVVTVVGAADPSLFQTHPRGNGKIGFCTAFYERKNPDRILNTIRLLPEFDFVLMGRNWTEYSQFAALQALGNFEYREAKYSEYPNFYRELDVFVSASQLEGGPIPLLEAMMSNVVPVASNTGFAPDVIEHGVNGFLFDADTQDAETLVALIRQAKALTGDIRETVVHYNWENYAHAHAQLFAGQALPGVNSRDSVQRRVA